MPSTSDNSWEKILVGSPSYYIYEQFDNDVNETKYDNYCSPFKNSENGADLEYFKLCKKMSRNTDILSKYHNKNEFTTLCSHYRYWTYYNIKRVLGEKTGNDKAKPIIHKFMQTQNNINEIYNAYYLGSPSYYIYEQFDNDVNETKYDNYCSPFKNSENGADLEYFKLCKKMSRNTDILSKYHNKNEFTTLCSHYRYWTYYNIKRVLGEKTGNDKAKPIIHKFMQTQNNINEIYNAYYCKYDFENDILERLNIMNEEKYLYDYFQNYDNIKTSDACNAVKSEEYEKYLNHIIELYNKHKTQKECCIDSFWPECEDYFKCNDEFDPKKLLSTLNSNRSKKCDNLIKAQAFLTSGNTSHTGNSLTNITDSIYYIKCADITNDKITDTTQVGGILNCHVFRTSDKSHIMPLSPSLQAPVLGPFTTYGQRGNYVSTKLLHENSVSRGITGNSDQSSSVQPSDGNTDKTTDKNTPCKDPLLVRDESGTCVQPDVRKTNTIGVKLNVFAPGKTIKIRLNPNSYMFKNKFFRGGIAFTLIVGIIFTIFLFYKFTPFGRCFHKKVSRKKRTDDYYDDPHMRQFIIRAPKYGRRRTGNRGLQFSYYSR
ncbi:PIR Superfamily Protein [Plasmodium malariae]|uniref:PIR Superfamily Protein n=1 Tax=Plasmodium malariae TaxID=5858 RepID=A0A1A8WQB6_PLAMA|nr:PIR Superfamily Protein [Plasmodium malariae]